jgi:hypothetical protein
MSEGEQPFVDRWPVTDEVRSKVTAPFDIARARRKLAGRFNVRPPKAPPATRASRSSRAAT